MKQYLLILFCGFTISLMAQVGIGTTTPNSNSILDLSTSDKGFLIVRIALSATNSASPLAAHVEGMMVYNTATAGTAPNNVTPGLYYNNGTAWERIVPESQAGKARGIERILTDDGTFTLNTGEFIYNSFTASVPSIVSSSVVAPYGSSTSYITITPAASATDFDTFTCSKNIISLRYYTQIQISAAGTNARWRSRLYLNGVIPAGGSNWSAPGNAANNVRTLGVVEYGPIAAGTVITVKLEQGTLPISTQNQGSYFIVEYEL